MVELSLSSLRAKNIFYLLLTAGFVAGHFIIDEMEHVWPWLGTNIYRNVIQTFIALSIAVCLNRLLRGLCHTYEARKGVRLPNITFTFVTVATYLITFIMALSMIWNYNVSSFFVGGSLLTTGAVLCLKEESFKCLL